MRVRAFLSLYLWTYTGVHTSTLSTVSQGTGQSATFSSTAAPSSTESSTTTSPVSADTSSMTASATTLYTTTTTPTSIFSSNLSCYDCSEAFKYLWEPYTECQYYPMNAPLRHCLPSDRYCKIERVTYRKMTVSISRGCTKECWHGCFASGFGLTKLKCTSCCLTPGCNTGNTAFMLRADRTLSLILTIVLLYLCLTQNKI